MLLTGCLLFGLALAAEDVGVRITDFNVPSSVKVGDNVTLTCQISLLKPPSEVDFMVKWFLLDNKGEKELYHLLPNNQRSRLNDDIVWNDSDTNGTIEIRNIQANYSGVYTCVASNYNEERRRQELAVYTPGSGPNLTITEEQSDTGDKNVLLACTAEGVAPEPELLIKNGELLSNGTYTQFSNVTGTWSAAANATISNEAAGSEFSCELVFTNENIVHELYINRISLPNSGGDPNTTEKADTVTPIPISADQQTGKGVRRMVCSWLVMLVSCSPLLLLGRFY